MVTYWIIERALSGSAEWELVASYQSKDGARSHVRQVRHRDAALGYRLRVTPEVW